MDENISKMGATSERKRRGPDGQVTNRDTEADKFDFDHLDRTVELAWQSREQSPEQSRSVVDQLQQHTDLSPLQLARTQVVKSYHLGRNFELRQSVDAGVTALSTIRRFTPGVKRNSFQ